MESISDRTVKLIKNKLVVEFPFDSFVVSVVSNLPGRKFVTKNKFWTVPPIQIENVINLLTFYNFHFDENVIALYKEHRIYKKKIARIKEGHLNQIEKDALEKTGIPFFGYQGIGAGFICAGKRVILADQPGTGKTIQTLGAIKIRNAKKVLIFCPVSAKKTWEEEIEKWLGEADQAVIIGGSPKERAEQWHEDKKYYIVNYHLLLRDMKFMQEFDWDFIVADEATDISNPTNKTTQLIKKLKSTYKVALTGTPISNTVKDIWSLMDWVQPGLLGTYWQFHREYCVTDSYNQIVSYKNLDKLRVKIEPYFLRRLKRDVLTELLPKMYETIYTEFSSQEESLYKAIQEDLKRELQEAGMLNKRNLSNAFVKMVRLKQMTCSSELINGERTSSKLNDLKELLKVILSGNEKAIIFSQFRSMAFILARELEEYNPLMIAGTIGEDERNENRKLFMEHDKYRLLIMTSAGSRSLNLQRASYVIHYDLPWSISALEQREDRAHRNGQLLSVTIYKMIVRGTIDEFNNGVLFSKNRTSNTVLGDSLEETTPKISKEELLNLLET